MDKPAIEEWLPLVNDRGEVIGKSTRARCHDGSKPLHPVVHLQVWNSAGALYLQKRTMTKDIQPGRWDTAVGGHVDYGETVAEALRRETREEIGVTRFVPLFWRRYLYESPQEKELVYSYRTVYDGVVTPNPSEIEIGRFWSIDEIVASLGGGLFTPNFEYEFQLLLEEGGQ